MINIHLQSYIKNHEDPCTFVKVIVNKMLCYRRETALQGALVLTKSEILELGDNILRTV